MHQLVMGILFQNLGKNNKLNANLKGMWKFPHRLLDNCDG